jgi:hypothetical protein
VQTLSSNPSPTKKNSKKKGTGCSVGNEQNLPAAALSRVVGGRGTSFSASDHLEHDHWTLSSFSLVKEGDSGLQRGPSGKR